MSDAVIIAMIGLISSVILSLIAFAQLYFLRRLDKGSDRAVKQRDDAAVQQTAVARKVAVVAEKQDAATLQVVGVKHALEVSTQHVASKVEAVAAQAAHDKNTQKIASAHAIELLEEVKTSLATETKEHRRHDDITEQAYVMTNGLMAAQLLLTKDATRKLACHTKDPADTEAANAAAVRYDEHMARMAIADAIPKRRAGDKPA